MFPLDYIETYVSDRFEFIRTSGRAHERLTDSGEDGMPRTFNTDMVIIRDQGKSLVQLQFHKLLTTSLYTIRLFPDAVTYLRLKDDNTFTDDWANSYHFSLKNGYLAFQTTSQQVFDQLLQVLLRVYTSAHHFNASMVDSSNTRASVDMRKSFLSERELYERFHNGRTWEYWRTRPEVMAARMRRNKYRIQRGEPPQ